MRVVVDVCSLRVCYYLLTTTSGSLEHDVNSTNNSCNMRESPKRIALIYRSRNRLPITVMAVNGMPISKGATKGVKGTEAPLL